MTERTINLDALAADLTAAGWVGEVTPIGHLDWKEAMLWLEDKQHGFTRKHKLHLAVMNGVFSYSVASYVESRLLEQSVLQDGVGISSEPFVTALDIIRRHADPMYAKHDQPSCAPTPVDLHASLIEIFNANTTPYGAGDATCFDFDGVAAADQILQLFGYPTIERPRREVPPAEEGEMPW